MRRIELTRYGPPEVMALRAMESLPQPGKDEVLIKVIAAGINPLDVKKRNGELALFYGRRFPMDIGNDVVGDVVVTGDGVIDFAPGDRVFCMVDSGRNNPLTGFVSGGGYADYCLTRSYTLARVPLYQPVEDLAAVPLASLTALQGLLRGGYRSKKRILINGASGGVGLFAVQMARAAGLHVSTVSNSRAIPLLREFGAVNTYDYRVDRIEALSSTYDLIFDVAATLRFHQCKHLLSGGGRFISNVASFETLAGAMAGSFRYFKKTMKTASFNWVKSSGRMLTDIADMIASGTLRPVVAREFPLEEAVQAHRYVETTSVIGKVILRV